MGFRAPFVTGAGREWHCGTCVLFYKRLFSCASLPPLAFAISPLSDPRASLSKPPCTRTQWSTSFQSPWTRPSLLRSHKCVSGASCGQSHGLEQETIVAFCKTTPENDFPLCELVCTYGHHLSCVLRCGRCHF